MSISTVIERWEAMGFLEALPRWEKEELAQIFEQSTKVMLFQTQAMDKDVVDAISDVFYPTLRRLYRRVGVRFELEKMVSALVKKASESMEELALPTTKEKNPILDFCIEFGDTYSDELTDIDIFTKEEYVERIDKALEFTRTVLLSDELVSYVNRDEDEWKIKYSDHKKSQNSVRVWNQQVGLTLLDQVIKDVNKGNK